MKTTHPTLRVSNLTYVRIMSALLEETASMSPEEAISIISAIRAYLSSDTELPLGGKHDELLCRYRDLIDRAARRSARAREAALKRKKQTSEPTPDHIENTITPTSPTIPEAPQKTKTTPNPAPRNRIKIKHRPARPTSKSSFSKRKLR